MNMKTLIAAALLLAGAGFLLAPHLRQASAEEPKSAADALDNLAALVAEAAKGGAPVPLAEADARWLDHMAGQMIMVGFAGDSASDRGVAAVRSQLADGVIGGVVLYPENIRSAQQLRNLTNFLGYAKLDPIPLIAVDQEGGMVQRLTRRNGHSNFPSARNVGSNPSYSKLESVFSLYNTMAHELADSGFNVNFGPVVDLDLNTSNPVIGRRKRSYGADPTTVTNLARDFILAHREANVVTVAKHFPGHGSSRTDSHKGFADISKTWHEAELDPYRTLAKEGLLDMVMVGHLYHPNFSDGERLPASLSGRAMMILRDVDDIGFDGVIVSDDMEMGAVRDAYSLEERVVKAVNAGTDLIVFSNEKSSDPQLGVKIHAIIVDAVRNGTIPMARIKQASGKLSLLKSRLMRHDLAGKG
jgi:beta-N-acetylhexosaminidase